MKSLSLAFLLAICALTTNGFLHSKKPQGGKGDHRVLSTVKIYSNLAEIIQPLGKLPIEFSADDWNDIRPDSVTLVGANVTVTQQAITEKRKSLNNAQVYVRTPSSPTAKPSFILGTLVDEQRNVVKFVDKDIGKETLYVKAAPDQLVYIEEPAASKYSVNFTYDTTDAVFLSYLRSNLNWKPRYQMNIPEDAKNPSLTAMADIRNDGSSRVDIEYAELLGGDINLQMYPTFHYGYMTHSVRPAASPAAGYDMTAQVSYESKPTVAQVEEVSGLYVFTVSEPISIEARTNYLIPMFRPRITVERYNSISKGFSGVGSFNGKADRSYRLTADRFLPRGNCVIRESDRLVGETTLPDLAAKNKHEFSVGQDADIIYKENITLLTSSLSNLTSFNFGKLQTRTTNTYEVNILLKNYKTNRAVKVEYTQLLNNQGAKLVKPATLFTQEGLAVKASFTLAADEAKTATYKIEVVS